MNEDFISDQIKVQKKMRKHRFFDEKRTLSYRKSIKAWKRMKRYIPTPYFRTFAS